MFGNKENINILTALLAQHGVSKAVVCPGSRNAPIVHNLNECESITCYPVTDERSAGFYALGMALADGSPVVVCVTSGTALLNLAPAVAEASYRHHGLIVVSADRPTAWIGQLDGQTLHQENAFGRFVSKCVNLTEPHDDTERWHCNRLVNEALLAVKARGRKSVHINVPISEPLFQFDVGRLPEERVIKSIRPMLDVHAFRTHVVKGLLAARKPMIVIGQISQPCIETERAIDAISKRIAVLSEPLAVGRQYLADLALANIGMDENYMPDFILYIGDTLVSKRLKAFLRKAGNAETWAVAEDGEVHDTFMHQAGVIDGAPVDAIMEIESAVSKKGEDGNDWFATQWLKLFDNVRERLSDHIPSYSQLAAVREFELSLANVKHNRHVHYANSNAVRLACIYASHYVWCNRGVNGIEGSLSTAAGFSLAVDGLVFCVIGDLSFFYDQNALWNTCLRGNLRIMLLNNHCGGIFYSLRGLQDSAAFDELVTAGHSAKAEGICRQNGVNYRAVNSMEELHGGIAWLTETESDSPMLLEVFTNPVEDKNAIKELMNKIKQP